MLLFPVYVSRAVLLLDITYTYYCNNRSLSDFRYRSQIDKSEIDMTCQAINNVKMQLCCFRGKPYYPRLFNKLVMTDFYVACAILKNAGIIYPSFSHREIHRLLQFPFSFIQCIKSVGGIYSNLFFVILSKFPSVISVHVINLLWEI